MGLPSGLPPGRVGLPAVAQESPAAMLQLVEVAPDLPSNPTWELLWISGPGTASPPRSPAPRLGPLLPVRQVPAPLLLGEGWENSRAAIPGYPHRHSRGESHCLGQTLFPLAYSW